MRTSIIMALLVLSANSQAANNSFFMNTKGQKLETQVALAASMRGEEILKCQQVKAEVSKNGSSISLKTQKASSK